MAKYRIENRTRVINEDTNQIEHEAKLKVAGLDSADVTDMQVPLIAVQQAWNAHGIEGQGGPVKASS